jgi:DNA helicase-2/ATP-dependent DNA helicase PcrA
MDTLADLNPAQREAVQSIGGPVLILAGPGSGKTRVITQRVAYLIRDCGVSPYNVMAVTFTNKAAREMKERLYRLLGSRLQQLTIGTFHAICAQILRKEGAAMGLDTHFVIYDDGDQMAAVRKALKDLQIDEKNFPPRPILNAISAAKNELIGPEEFAADNYWREIARRVYRRYQEVLAEAKALDFDDLLLLAVRLLQEHPDVLDKYQRRYVHVLVDEFQDTNVAQYVLIKLIGGRYRHVCVVGDEDQSIYRFRGADIRNILSFEQDYPDARVIVLEQNYRSTQTILEASRGVIRPNVQRKEKRLWTQNDPGVPVTVFEAYNEQEEGQYVVSEIERLRGQGYGHKDFAVMYRTNAQSRALEDAFVRAGLPYRLVGATRFYERREIKDVLAYLRLIHNPFDGLSLARILNVPGRGLGPRTLADLERWASGLGVPLYTALQLLERRTASEEQAGAGEQGSKGARENSPLRPGTSAPPLPFAPRFQNALLGFLHLVDDLIAAKEGRPVLEVLDLVLDKTGYAAYLRDGSQEGEERWENVQELRSVARQYDVESPEGGLAGFLEGVALVSEVDNYEERVDAVTLLTLHSAKGLEFPVVFIVGLEEGLLPHARSIDNGYERPEELEEERRLCYVGITRAMQRLYLVHAFRRTLWGSSQVRDPSRFLADIPPQLIKGRDLPAETRLPAADEKVPLFPPARLATVGPTTSPAPKVTTSPFKTGDKVRHAKFGEGIVVEVKPVKEDVEVTVAFAGVGVKRLSLAFARLERDEG